MPRNRFQNALDIQGGACNPSGIALAIVDGVQEARKDGKDACKDAAVRLMVHQLAYICGIAEIEDGFEVYHNLTKECEAGKETMKNAKTA